VLIFASELAVGAKSRELELELFRFIAPMLEVVDVAVDDDLEARLNPNRLLVVLLVPVFDVRMLLCVDVWERAVPVRDGAFSNDSLDFAEAKVPLSPALELGLATVLPATSDFSFCS
jgi:hypothetical protein